jgi:carbon starvation protein
MIILVIMAGSGLLLFLGGRFYAPLIGKVLGERPDRVAPSVAINDGRDYVPTRTPVVFAHHYASIAGAGPIIGPVLAILYGWGPALLWILLGGIFLGAVHDYAATHIAMREGGKNLTVVARRYIGPGAFVMLLIFMVALLALVCAAFLDLSATALTSKVDIATLALAPDQGLFRVEDGQAVIGGIASTSVIVITACSPLIGFLYLKRKFPVWLCSVLAVGICGISILIGLKFPLTVQPETWKLMISGYVLLSAGLPVWLFLQSRDFINVHILYVGIVFLFIALIAAAVRGGGEMAAAATAIPMNNWTEASAHPKLGPGWPVMFVIIACGAVSGFHSLCAGGTTCKQLKNEVAARQVGYYGMLLESFLAVCVICCLIVGLSKSSYIGYCYPEDPNIKGNAILTFAMAVGHTVNVGLGLPIAAGALGAMLLLEGFLVTTLDTAIRLTRYMIEEGWATFFGRYDVFAPVVEPAGGKMESFEVAGTGGIGFNEPHNLESEPTKTIIKTQGLTRVALHFLKYYWVNSGLAVVIMLLLGWDNGYKVLWSIFGSANQLLAALALVVGSLWLIHMKRPVWYTLLPALFMLVTSLTMVVRLLFTKYIPDWPGSAPLVITDILILAMSVGIIILAFRSWVSAKLK